MDLEIVKKKERQQTFNDYVDAWARERKTSVGEILKLKLVQEYADQLGVKYTGDGVESEEWKEEMEQLADYGCMGMEREVEE